MTPQEKILIPDVFEKLTSNQGMSTLIVVLALIVIRFLSDRYLQQREGLAADQKRRIRANIRNTLFLVTLVALIVIWAPALRTFVISIAAFTVAIVLATKELILCVSGALVATTGKGIRVGSWIEVGKVRGEVVDQTLITTTVQELGGASSDYAFSGRTVVLPNSIFLSTPVANERFHKRFVFHPSSLVMEASLEPGPVADAMKQAMQGAVRDSEERAARYLAAIEARADVSMPPPQPTCRIKVLNDGMVKITLTAFVPTQDAAAIDRQVLEAGLRAVRAQMQAKELAAASQQSVPG